MRESTNIFDCNGKEYHVGDVALNPFCGDFWLVEKFTQEEKIKNNSECNYYFSQYGNKNRYFMELTEPDGFEIVCTPDSEDYTQLLQEFKELNKKYEEEINN